MSAWALRGEAEVERGWGAIIGRRADVVAGWWSWERVGVGGGEDGSPTCGCMRGVPADTGYAWTHNVYMSVGVMKERWRGEERTEPCGLRGSIIALQKRSLVSLSYFRPVQLNGHHLTVTMFNKCPKIESCLPLGGGT